MERVEENKFSNRAQWSQLIIHLQLFISPKMSIEAVERTQN